MITKQKRSKMLQSIFPGAPPSSRNNALLNMESLREQVYRHLREEMHKGALPPGESINLNRIGQELGVSKTPLRDAFIRLESEGFVTILPRRGIRVNELALNDIKESLEIVGALEGAVIASVFDNLDTRHLTEMEKLNSEMIAAVSQGDFDSYYSLNLSFHDVYLRLSDNESLQHMITPIKQRLYDFPRRAYIKEWELINCNEHRLFMDSISRGDRKKAVRIMRDSHWSFEVHERFIRRFYFSSDD
jgi:DNA-binding GntR family transcriptional regulator